MLQPKNQTAVLSRGFGPPKVDDALANQTAESDPRLGRSAAPATESDVLVRVEGLSKKFCRSLKKSLWYGVLDMAAELNPYADSARPSGPTNRSSWLRTDEFWAVKDVTFELRRGECLGLIGRNGAGKTTLLKMLNGLIKPDEGRAEMKGQVGALISLGAGFNPILSGRENIYVNSSLMGITNDQISSKIDDIIDFSGIGEFIDSPVQSYSSGMQVRLGFAVATALEPDILILDEVLAVGDAAFRFKCYRRIDELRRKAAVIFVSHDMPSVGRICDQALVLAQGRVKFHGPTSKGVEVYDSVNEEGHSVEQGFIEVVPPVTSFEVAPLPAELDFRSPLCVEITLVSEKAMGEASLRINLHNMAGAYAASGVVDSSEHRVIIGDGTVRWRIEIASLPLKAGRYEITFGLTDAKGGLVALSYRRHTIRMTGGHSGTVGDCQLDVRSWITIESSERLG